MLKFFKRSHAEEKIAASKGEAPAKASVAVKKAAGPIRGGYFVDLTTQLLVSGIDQVSRGATMRRYDVGEVRRLMSEGELDVGLLPVWDFLQAGKLRLVPGAAISTVGPASMYLLCSKVLPTEISHILVDHESFGARSIAEILLPQQTGVRPEFHRSDVPLDPLKFDFDRSGHSAFLIVGEHALRTRKDYFAWTWDLSEAWHGYAQAPLGMHVWCCQPGVNLKGLEQELEGLARQNSKSPGVIVRTESERTGISERSMEVILQSLLHTACGPAEISGMRRYVKELVRARLNVSMRQFNVYQSPEGSGIRRAYG